MEAAEFDEAIRSYWNVRECQAAKQITSGKGDTGLRGAVTGGASIPIHCITQSATFSSVAFPFRSLTSCSGTAYRLVPAWPLLSQAEGIMSAYRSSRPTVSTRSRPEEARNSGVNPAPL